MLYAPRNFCNLDYNVLKARLRKICIIYNEHLIPYPEAFCESYI